jgi:cyclohexa-1,5-dienecarbonyl-CoA hydratase
MISKLVKYWAEQQLVSNRKGEEYMEFKTILIEEKDLIGKIIFNTPPLNILNIEMMIELNQAITYFKNKNLKLLVIAANGKAFSAGVDVSDHTKEKVNEMIKVFHKIFTNLSDISAPILALVNGAALGGGCEIAMFCDIVIASEKSKFGQPEIQVGVFPPIAAAIFPKLIFPKKALELMVTGEIISAKKAQELGLINHVFPVDTFEDEVETFITEKIANNSAIALQLTKKAFLEGVTHKYSDAIANIEDIYLKKLMKTYDANEGLTAFLEKRKPDWKNK